MNIAILKHLVHTGQKLLSPIAAFSPTCFKQGMNDSVEGLLVGFKLHVIQPLHPDENLLGSKGQPSPRKTS